MRKSRALARRVTMAVVSSALVASGFLTLEGTSLAANSSMSVIATPRPSCPWVKESRRHAKSPSALAEQVVAKMTLLEKAKFVTLSNGHDIENYNQGVPSLCLPPLTLSDGPNGIAGLTPGVTQLPAAIGIGASFDSSLARATGELVGQEARTKGIDVVQGPDLNLARVPESGRIFESYGEDPYLTSALGVADIEGIQSTGVMALAKHFTAYSQETARARIDDDVTPRALDEIYNAPFEAAVKDAHVAALMCASGLLNGESVCSDPYIYATLKSWGFTGFIRSDLRAATHPALAFDAGLEMIKGASAGLIEKLVQLKRLPVADLNRSVRAIVTQMFAYGLIAHQRVTDAYVRATTSAHAAVALRAAQESIVLLKNDDHELPLPTSHTSIAVIGADASLDPDTSGEGSSAVVAPFVITPLTGIRSAVGKDVTITYSSGAPNEIPLGSLDNTGTVSLKPHPIVTGTGLTSQLANDDLSIEAAANVTNTVNTESEPATGRGWSHWTAVFHAKATGEYEVAVEQVGDTWFSMNGRRILASSGLHEPITMTDMVRLKKGHRYTFKGTWFTVKRNGPPEFGLSNVTSRIQAAVSAARAAKSAVVFVSQPSTEGADQTTLNLPGDENQLIEAVAAANPHTVVVLNTEGAVLMPWLSQVQSVVEAWYPGEQDGTAIASVLFGSFDPTGHLPLTFPSSQTTQPLTSVADFPGIDDEVDFGSGSDALDIGYRWYQAHNVQPLFSFGFGLSYTTFTLENPSLEVNASDVIVHLDVTNVGAREGTDVVQSYVKFPAAAGEPPEQLKAIARVKLPPLATRRISLAIPISSLSIYLNNTTQVLAGKYEVSVGQSSADLPLSLQVKIP